MSDRKLRLFNWILYMGLGIAITLLVMYVGDIINIGRWGK